MNPSELLEEAVKELEYLETGEQFLVKELFKGYEWKRLPIKLRLALGTLFLNYAFNSKIITVLGKTSSNQQIYKKN